MDALKKEDLALKEVRLLYNQFNAARDLMDEKAMNLLSSSSLILTLFGILQIVLIKESQSPLYKIGLFVAVLLYLCLVAVILMILRPQGYRGAFKATWAGVKGAILNLDSQTAFYQLIGNYLDRIQKNKSINVQKKKWLQVAIILFALIMIILVSTSLFVGR